MSETIDYSVAEEHIRLFKKEISERIGRMPRRIRCAIGLSNETVQQLMEKTIKKMRENMSKTIDYSVVEEHIRLFKKEISERLGRMPCRIRCTIGLSSETIQQLMEKTIKKMREDTVN